MGGDEGKGGKEEKGRIGIRRKYEKSSWTSWTTIIVFSHIPHPAATARWPPYSAPWIQKHHCLLITSGALIFKKAPEVGGRLVWLWQKRRLAPEKITNIKSELICQTLTIEPATPIQKRTKRYKVLSQNLLKPSQHSCLKGKVLDSAPKMKILQGGAKST